MQSPCLQENTNENKGFLQPAGDVSRQHFDPTRALQRTTVSKNEISERDQLPGVTLRSALQVFCLGALLHLQAVGRFQKFRSWRAHVGSNVAGKHFQRH